MRVTLRANCRIVFVLFALLFWESAFAQGQLIAPAPEALSELDQWEYAWSDVRGFRPLDLKDNISERSISDILWMRTKIPSHFLASKFPTGIWLPRVRYQFKAYLGDASGPLGQAIYQFGNPEKSGKFIGSPSHRFSLPAWSAGDLNSSSQKMLYLKIRSNYSRIGLLKGAMVGSELKILEMIVKKDMALTIQASLSITLGIILVLIILATRRSDLFLSFAMIPISIGVYSFCKTDLKLLLFKWTLGWDYLQAIATYLIPVFFVGFSQKLFAPHKTPALAILKYSLAAFAFASVLAASLGLYDLNQSLVVFQIGLLWGIVAYLTILKQYMKQGVVLAKEFIIGVSVLCVAACHDILVEWAVLTWSVSVTNPALNVLLVVLGILTMNHFIKVERNRLQLENEIQAGGFIQQHFMPSGTFKEQRFTISIFNHAASHVGGDWYYHKLVDDRWLHVHVGDVTGHGVGAGLTTAYLQGVVETWYENFSQQTMREFENPPIDSLHTWINDVLTELGECTISSTLASICIDLRTNVMTYVNSGHLPVLTRKPEAPKFEKGRSRNNLLLGIGSEFVCKAPFPVDMGGQDTIVMYSDGLGQLLDKKVLRRNFRKLQKFLIGVTESTTEKIKHDVRKEIAEYPGDLDDDVTVVKIQLCNPVEISQGKKVS